MYQDSISEDGTVTEGYRSCTDRYEVVRRVASQLRHPFTVLDLGAASGYFSIRLTEDFGARVVAVEGCDEIEAARGSVAAIVRRNLQAEDVRLLGTFDLVLALSFLHHQKRWREMLHTIERSARSALIVETPNPLERLKQAKARHELAVIDRTVRKMGLQKIGSAPGVWSPELHRGIYALRRRGLPVVGKIASGSGNNGLHVSRFADDLTPILGYQPFTGSLNVMTPRAFRLGAYAAEYVDQRRGRGGRGGGDYQIWCATVDGFDGPAHVIRPGVRNHGRKCLEVWAPVHLKTALGKKDGDPIRLRIGA